MDLAQGEAPGLIYTIRSLILEQKYALGVPRSITRNLMMPKATVERIGAVRNILW